jgi:hypothetical protein
MTGPRLVNAIQPEQIYLFGSRARGDNQADSDYDLMIVVPASDLPPHRRAQHAHRVLGGMQVAPTSWFGPARSSIASYRSPGRSLLRSSARVGCSMTLDPKAELTRQWLQVSADDLSPPVVPGLP